MKYLFFDYDGTLTCDGRISEKNIAALVKAKTAGHKIFLHTGRSKSNVPDDAFEGIDWDGMICGKGYMEYEGNVLFEYCHSPEILMRALDYCTEKGTRVLWEGVEHVYSNHPNEWLVDISKHLPPTEELRVTTIQLGGPMSNEDAKRFEDVEMCSYPGYSEITPKGVTKSTGLEYIEREFGVPHEDIIVFGDSENDLEMIRYAKISVIMNHAPESLWQYATIRTESDENGVAEGIEKLLF